MAATLLMLAGCSGGIVGTSSGSGSTGGTGITAGVPGPGFSGKVLAGSTPLAGASVRIFAAGTAGNGSAPTQLLTAALVTDTGGTFDVAGGSYNCPTSDSVLYLVATGGAIGTASSNAAAQLITVAGACNGLVSQTYTLNEFTTVGTVLALRPFLGRGGQLGYAATNVGGFQLALATLARLVSLPTGSPGLQFPANGSAPTRKMNSLANLLNACVASTGSTSAGCASLFLDTSAPGFFVTNTLDAALAIANAPGSHVADLFTLSQQSSVYTPAILLATPADWTLAVPFTGGGLNGPTSVAIDSTGRVWVANYFGAASLFANSGAPLLASGITGYGLQESYGAAVDATDRFWVANEENSEYGINNGVGSLTILNSTGPALPGNSVFSSGGLNFPISVAFDRSGNAWVVDYGNSHLSLLNAAGAPLSGAAGYTSSQFAFPVAVAVDSQGNGWVANQSASTVTRVTPDGKAFTSYTVGNGPSAVAVDAADNVWAANYYGDSVGLVSAAGRVLSAGGYVEGGLNHPTGIAVDGAGTAWVANYRAPGISAFAGAQAAVPGAALTGSSGWGSDVGLLEAFGIAVDAAGDVWASSYGDSRLVEFVGVAAPVKTPLLGGVRVP